LRELLYTKQLDLAIRIFRRFGRVRIFLVMLKPDNEYCDQARSDLADMVHRLSLLEDEAAVLFPTELFVAVREACRTLSPILEQFDEGRDVSELIEEFRGYDAKAAVMARALFGVDELSTQSIGLFAKEESLDQLASIHPQDILRKSEGKPP
jgi:hypothetical protein